MSTGGFRSQRTPVITGKDRFGGRNGELYGWSRAGRVRLHTPSLLSENLASINRSSRVNSGLHPDETGRVLGDLHHDPFDRRLSYVDHETRYLDDHLLDPHRNSYARGRPQLSWDLGAPDGFGRSRPYVSDALGIADTGRGSTSGSVSSGSDYSLNHLDRFSRPYHYQPPYVEDYESDIEEELRRRHDDLEARYGMISRDYYIGVGPGEDTFDARRRFV